MRSVYKILVIGLVLCFASCLAVAEELSKRNLTGTTTVSLTVPSEYQVSIPSDLDLPYASESTDLPLAVTYLVLAEGKTLTITAAPTEGQLVQTEGDGVIPFSLQQDGEGFSYAAFTTLGETNVQIVIDRKSWLEAPAGSYSGIINFSVSIIDADEKEGD